VEPRTYSIAQARNAFSRLVREVERGGAIVLTRRGKQVAVVLSQAEYARLRSGASRFREAFAAFMASRPTGGWLTEKQIRALRDRRPARRVTVWKVDCP
jgi:prevent-host-death family protein